MTTTRRRAQEIDLSDLDRRIVNRLQEGLPLVAEPFAYVAREIGCTEAELLERTAQQIGRASCRERV